jgi:hypothetical protein
MLSEINSIVYWHMIGHSFILLHTLFLHCLAIYRKRSALDPTPPHHPPVWLFPYIIFRDVNEYSNSLRYHRCSNNFYVFKWSVKKKCTWEFTNLELNWMHNEVTFPFISKITSKYLSFPAASVPTVNIFDCRCPSI